MKTLALRITAALLAVVILAACSSAASSASTVQTTKTVYATGLPHAAAFAFDSTQRLWVATAAYTDDGTDGVYLVSKQGATPVEVITSLHTPLGLLWSHDSLYVAQKGRVVAYSGLVGTKFTKQRTVVSFPSGTGELNNLVLAPDGRILLGISSPCDHCATIPKYSASIVSFRPDGTDLRTYASGIRAPVGLTFNAQGELLVTMDQRDDLGAATPGDWLAHVTEGSAWGYPAVSTNTPIAVLDKHGAVAGVAMQGDDAIVAEWATGKVVRVTPSGKVSTFATGIKNPVAVVVTGDGAVLVGDWATGTIYRY
jgi:glucose/arabinose dehydrogenase